MVKDILSFKRLVSHKIIFKIRKKNRKKEFRIIWLDWLFLLLELWLRVKIKGITFFGLESLSNSYISFSDIGFVLSLFRYGCDSYFTGNDFSNCSGVFAILTTFPYSLSKPCFPKTPSFRSFSFCRFFILLSKNDLCSSSYYFLKHCLISACSYSFSAIRLEIVEIALLSSCTTFGVKMNFWFFSAVSESLFHLFSAVPGR